MNSYMNTGIADQAPHRRRARLGRGCVAATATAALLVAACGSTSSSNDGSGSPGTATASTTYGKEVAYSQCMRAHGVPGFPDPSRNGGFVVNPGNSGSYDPNSPVALAARQTCRRLLPNGGKVNPEQQQKTLDEDLKYATCMRAHGVADFPDPTTNSQGGVDILLPSSINVNSSQYVSAAKACESLNPHSGAGS